MSLRTLTSPKNVSVLSRITRAARSRIAQMGLAAGLTVAAAYGQAEAQDRPAVCTAGDVPCPGGTELRTGPRTRGTSRTRHDPDAPTPPPVEGCGDSGAHTPVANVESYLRDPVVHARIERMHPGLDMTHATAYTLNVPVSVSRLTWDDARVEPRTDSRTLPANTRVVGVRVNDAGHYDAAGRQIYLVLDTNCGDVISGVISVDNASVPVAAAETSRDAGSATDASADSAHREETSRVRDDVETRRDVDEGDAADAYAPPPERRGPYVEVQLGGGALFGTQGGTEVRTVDRMVGMSGAFRITASNPTPELSASGPTGRYIAVLNISGGTAPYTVSIPGVEVAPTSGGNSYNVIGTPGTYTATVTDGSGHTEMIPVEINGARITAGGSGGTTTTRTTETHHVDYHTVILPSLSLLVGGRPFGDAFDIAGGVEAGFLLEQAITRDAMGHVVSSNWDFRPWDFNMQLRLAAAIGSNREFLLGSRTRLHFVAPLDGLEETFTFQWNSHGQLDSAAFILGADLGIYIPFHAREGGWAVNPVLRAYAGIRF